MNRACGGGRALSISLTRCWAKKARSHRKHRAKSRNGLTKVYTEATQRSKPKIIPYDFQVAGATSLIESDGNPLAVYATGGGKSVVLADVCRRLNTRTLTLAPTRELCEQNEKAMLAVWPEADVGIVCAGLKRREYAARNVIATIHSVYSLHKQNKLELIGARPLIIIDEAHLVPNGEVGMYRAIIKSLAPDKVMGATATAYRLESGRLDEGDDRLFDRVVYEFGLRDGINWRGPNGERLLLPLVAKKTASEIDTSGVKIRAGDFVEKELEERANTAALVNEAVDEILRYAHGRNRWLAFCCGADHSKHVAQVLKTRGITAAALTFLTPSDERKEIIGAYRRGEITCLCGCNIFTTGFNVPEVDLIAFLRPTQSPGLYVQMAGRGTRYADDKTDCLVLDFARNVQRLGPVDDPLIPDTKEKGEGNKDRGKTAQTEMKACPECNTYTLAAASYCSQCGHVFEREPPPAKHGTVASDAAIMSEELVWREVQRIGIYLHNKPEKPPSVKIAYLIDDGRWVPQWLAFDHPKGCYFARRNWRSLGGHLPEPHSTAEALRRRNEIRKPEAIGLKRDGDFWRVEKVRHAHAG
jgi:DNA repair protein RadD